MEKTGGETSTNLVNVQQDKKIFQKGELPRRTPAQLQAQWSLEGVRDQAAGDCWQN